jgi:putative nucleotidyltransferase with HDIG domain
VSATPERTRSARLFRRLSGFPRPDGTGHALLHGARLALLLGLALGITLVFPPVPSIEIEPYQLGSVADEDVIAQFGFPIRKSDEELERERAEAAAAVPPTLDQQAGAADSMVAALERFFEGVDTAASSARADSTAQAVMGFLQRVGVPASPAQAELLADPEDRSALRRAAIEGTEELLPEGVYGPLSARYAGSEQFKVREAGGVESYVSRSDARSAADFYNEAVRRLPLDASTADNQALLRLILIRHLLPTYTINERVTEEERNQARSAVSMIKSEVLAGEAIVRANQRIGQAELERLEAYREQQQAFGPSARTGVRASAMFGSVLFHSLMLLVFALVLLYFRPSVYGNFRWILVFTLLIASYFAAAAVIGGFESSRPELVPVAFVSLIVAVLFDGRLALALAGVLAVMTGFIRPFDTFYALPTLFVAGAAAALSVRAVRRRTQFWIFSLIITVAHATAIFAVGMMTGMATGEMFGAVPWAAVGATASAILAMGFLPVFEWFTGITTDQTLLEWADPNRELLGRLSREAPGTYAHTIGVANLAEAAAKAIGADGLLCRVGAYYHDVGKVLKPQYFIENQPSGRNPHDRLKPETSAAIVREHVTEGYRMAKDEGVPPVVLDFVLEHHGTQRIGFFYDKALEEAEDPSDIDPAHFSYPGPKPQSRETAILMIADSLESATRALQDPTPKRIGELVNSILTHKTDDEQLDEAPLTLRELTQIRDEFIKVLEGMYHHRIDYPATRHLTESPTADAVRA